MSKEREPMKPEDWKLILSLADKCARSLWEANGAPRVEGGERVVVDDRHMPTTADNACLKSLVEHFDLHLDVVTGAFIRRFQTHYGCLLLGA